jgi:hybrid cluster-associated redox disulfide protein
MCAGGGGGGSRAARIDARYWYGSRNTLRYRNVAGSPNTFNAGSLGAEPPMQPDSIDPFMTVDEIMRLWPQTMRVMIKFKMLCIGCPVARFHTLADACAAHGLDEAAVTSEMIAAMGRANSPDAA